MDVILLDEIEQVKEFVKTDNTESAVGNLSQKLTAIFNYVVDRIGTTDATGGTTTAGTVMAKLNAVINNANTNNNESSTGVLSQKLTYLINRIDRVYIPSSTNLKTFATSLSIGTVSKGSTETKTAWSNYTTAYSVCFDGTYRFYCTGTATVSSVYSGSYSPGASDSNSLILEINVNGSVVKELVVATQGKSVGTTAATTKTVDVSLKRGDIVKVSAGARSTAGYTECEGQYVTNTMTAAITDISARGTAKEFSTPFV